MSINVLVNGAVLTAGINASVDKEVRHALPVALLGAPAMPPSLIFILNERR